MYKRPKLSGLTSDADSGARRKWDAAVPVSEARTFGAASVGVP